MEQTLRAALRRSKEVGQLGLVVEIAHLDDLLVLPEEVDVLEEQQSGEEGGEVHQGADQQEEPGDGRGGVQGREPGVPGGVDAQPAVEQGVIADLEVGVGNALGVVAKLLGQIGPAALRAGLSAAGVPA